MEDTLYAKCSCDHCGGHISFPVDLADSNINCPHCQGSTRLSFIAPPTSSAERPSAAEILNAFGPPVSKTRVSLAYQLGLVLVVVVMGVMLATYLAMVAGVGYVIVRYARQCNPLGGVFNPFIFLFYLVPILGGVVLVLLMLKPLFVSRAPRLQPLALDPGINSALYAFIAKVAESVGAPMPTRIYLTCDLNASAGFRRGLGGVVRNEFVLTIGLPLVAALNLREFAVVVAHEFGHFAQGIGMRLSYAVRCFIAWFARMAYEQDAWDARLQETMDAAPDGRLMLLAGFAQLLFALPRLVLKTLMWFGHGVSCFLLRQMEYDADSYAIKVAGSATAERTTIKANILGAALQKTYKEIRTTWNTSRKLPDDFPAFFLFQESRLPRALRKKIEDTVGLSRTGLFGTHPSDGDRIRKARQAQEPGIFHLQHPASILFYDFGIVSKQITLLHYRDDIGVDCDASNLRPLEFYTRAATV